MIGSGNLLVMLPQAHLVLAFGAALDHWRTRHGGLIGPGAHLVQVDAEARAIGAAVAAPERLTVAALGDGGRFPALQDLDSVARAGVRLLIAVHDDAAYGAEVHHFAPMRHDAEIVAFPDADIAEVDPSICADRLQEAFRAG